MLRSRRETLSEIEITEQAWSTIAPEETFFGLTLDQYRAKVRPVYDLRAEGAELDRRRAGNVAMLNDADAAALRLTRNIGGSVKAHPKYGEDSPLYAAMGYIRRSERKSGLKRPRAAKVMKPEGEEKS